MAQAEQALTKEALVRPRAPTGQRTRAGFWRQNEGLLVGAASVLVFMLVWEAWVRLGNVSALFLSPPSRIFEVAVNELFVTRAIWDDLAVSGYELALGYVLSVLVAIPLGVVLGWYRRVNMVFNPFVSFMYAVPRVAFLPMIVMWVGIGLGSKIVIVFLSAVFPILISTIAGIRTLDHDLVKCARSFGANDRQLFRTVALPGSVPFILTGMRLGVGRALIGVVVGELYAATIGLGHYMSQSGAQYRTDKVFFAVLIFGFTGMVIMALVERIEARFQAWRPQTRT